MSEAPFKTHGKQIVYGDDLILGTCENEDAATRRALKANVIHEKRLAENRVLYGEIDKLNYQIAIKDGQLMSSQMLVEKLSAAHANNGMLGEPCMFENPGSNWRGPYILNAIFRGQYAYQDEKTLNRWMHCRRATADERAKSEL